MSHPCGVLLEIHGWGAVLRQLEVSYQLTGLESAELEGAC